MGKHRFKPEDVHKLHDPKRVEILPPQKILREFGVQGGDVVADLGAGSGYFTLPIAHITGETVYAVDIEPKMLDQLRERARAENVSDSIHAVVSDLENIQLEDRIADKAVAAFVLHEVSNLGKALGEIKRILKPGGKALALEWRKIKTETGPPLHERLDPEMFTNEARQHGFHAEISYPNRDHYGVTLTPRT